MWLPRTKSTVRVRKTPSTNFSCSSFKDIQHLCSEDSDSTPPYPSVFHRVCLVNSLFRTWKNRLPNHVISNGPPETAGAQSQPSISLPGAENRIIMYFTSLHVVRSTFEDCRAVRSILRGFRVLIDERDVTMDSKFMDELKAVFGHCNKAKVALPRVFVGGWYVGGAEEIKQLHESGELKKLVKQLPAAEPGACEVCGDYRFILCDECSGSHKCYSDKGGFRTCTACNENGLIRCPSCSPL